jgi:hypothetical protein
MNFFSKRRPLLGVLGLTLLAATTACSATDSSGSPEGEAESTAQSAEQFLYSETLPGGAELRVFQLGDHVAAFGVVAPIDGDEALKSRIAASEREQTVEGAYSALVGADRALPRELEGLAEKVRSVATPTSLAAFPAEKLVEFNGGDDVGSARASAGDVGVAKQALGQDDTWDWNGDASWFTTNYCAIDNIKRTNVSCRTNFTWTSTAWLARYHFGTGMAASFNGGATFSVYHSDCTNCAFVEYTNLRLNLASRYLGTWHFMGDETYINRKFRTDGLGPTPRVHQSTTVGFPKIVSVSTVPTQFPEFDLKIHASSFLAGSSVTFAYMHPTVGAINLTTGTTKADSTVFPPGAKLRCEILQLRRQQAYFTGTIRARGTDGREATISTNTLYNACGPFAPL